jgi:formylglycine-generating enzyme required for sulfatase activity
MLQKTTSLRISSSAVIVTLAFTATSPKPAAAQSASDALGRATRATGTTEWTNSIDMKFVRIGPGRFVMGTPEEEPSRLSNEKQHEVRITKAYLLGVHEVTRVQFRAFVSDTGYETDAELRPHLDRQRVSEAKGGSWRDVGFEQTDDHPVVNMSWNDAQTSLGGSARKRAGTIGCPRRPNGNGHAAQARRQPTLGVTTPMMALDLPIRAIKLPNVGSRI